MPPEQKDEVDAGEIEPARLNEAELLCKVRDYIGKALEPSDGSVSNYDVEQNMREIRAILSTNTEIFERCMQSKISNSNNKTFNRWCIDSVETYVVVMSKTTHFVGYPERQTKSFDMTPLLKLPTGLDDIFVVKHQEAPYTEFIDYGSFFNKSLILHEDVLGPFLAKLKVHLMSIQVCLGEIEAWITQLECNMKYLESTFDVKIKIERPGKTEELTQVCKCPPETHPTHHMCQRTCCGRSIDNHEPSTKNCYNEYNHRSYRDTYHSYGFMCKKMQTLKKCVTKMPVKIEMTCNISKEDDRQRLEKILEFMEI